MKTLHDEKHVFDSQTLKYNKKKGLLKTQYTTISVVGFNLNISCRNFCTVWRRDNCLVTRKTSTTIKIELLHENKLFPKFF